MTQSCGGRDTILNDRNSIHDDWKMLERWSKANKGAKYKFYIWIKKNKTQWYKDRMENTWVKSSKR